MTKDGEDLISRLGGPEVTVVANDYSYDGTIVAIFAKLSEQVRVVVEDDKGRLFIHNPSQLTRLRTAAVDNDSVRGREGE
jgi:hypothetical protein